MTKVIIDNGVLVWRHGRVTVSVSPWGSSGFRVTAWTGPAPEIRPWALTRVPDRGCGPDPNCSNGETGSLHNGSALAHISENGFVKITDTSTGRVLVEELGREFKSLNGGMNKATLILRAWEDERFYGLGQHQHGFLDQKGCVIDLLQRNTEISIPFAVSSRGYGFLWNNPAIGRVELGRSGTRWIAERTDYLDYWVTADRTFAGVLRSYAEATGFPPEFPEWAAGFWQSKLRYKDQGELLGVVREYKRRGLPLSVIVADYFHWTIMGEWRFDPAFWPDPSGMVDELRDMGVELMVSVWPTVNPNSCNYGAMKDGGLLVETERGVQANTVFVDTRPEGHVFASHYDATNPKAREFVWDKVGSGYLKAGIRLYWLDACEPELNPADHDNLSYYLGNGAVVGNIYPLENQRTFFDGLASEGEEGIIMLSRSAWAGSQRFGAVVWSGDIPSTFEALGKQVRAGLNMAMSGIPWWTTDIGGFHGGDADDPDFRELIVRWFQYGVFCPVFRLHGVREPGSFMSGGPNEVWSFGEEAYDMIKDALFLRERLRPYIMKQMDTAHKEGIPPMRPIFFDFPTDESYMVEDEFLFGPDLLVAPILQRGAGSREVHLPAGPIWADAWTGEVFPGGVSITVRVPLNRIPVFVRDGKDELMELFGEVQ